MTFVSWNFPLRRSFSDLRPKAPSFLAHKLASILSSRCGSQPEMLFSLFSFPRRGRVIVVLNALLWTSEHSSLWLLGCHVFQLLKEWALVCKQLGFEFQLQHAQALWFWILQLISQVPPLRNEANAGVCHPACAWGLKGQQHESVQCWAASTQSWGPLIRFFYLLCCEVLMERLHFIHLDFWSPSDFDSGFLAHKNTNMCMHTVLWVLKITEPWHLYPGAHHSPLTSVERDALSNNAAFE